MILFCRTCCRCCGPPLGRRPQLHRDHRGCSQPRLRGTADLSCLRNAWRRSHHSRAAQNVKRRRGRGWPVYALPRRGRGWRGVPGLWREGRAGAGVQRGAAYAGRLNKPGSHGYALRVGPSGRRLLHGCPKEREEGGGIRERGVRDGGMARSRSRTDLKLLLNFLSQKYFQQNIFGY